MTKLPMMRAGRILAIGLLLLSVCSCGEVRREQPVARDGVIDLSDWDFEKDGMVSLGGQWNFVWEEFVEPMPIDAFRAKYRGLIDVPGTWRATPDSKNPGQVLSGTGFGTYVLEVRLPPGLSSESLGFFMRTATSAATWDIYSEDGSRLLARIEQGVPGLKAGISRPMYFQAATNLPPGVENRVLVLVKVSNFHHARGGMTYNPKLGLSQHVGEFLLWDNVVDATTFGILLIIAIYHFVLFGQRRDDEVSLCFAVFCGVIAIRHWVTALFPAGLGWVNTVDGFLFYSALEYATMPLCLIACLWFMESLVPNPRFKLVFVKIWGGGIGMILTLATVVLDPITYSSLIGLYQVHLLVGAGAGLVYIARATVQRVVLAKWVLLAFGIGVFGIVHDILHVQMVIRSTYIGPYTFIAFILMQSGIISGKFSWAFHRLEKVKGELVEALDRARAADRLKGEILATLSHELRTPMNALINVPKLLATRLYATSTWQCHTCDIVFEDDGDESTNDDSLACPECGEGLTAYTQLQTSMNVSDITQLLERSAESGNHLDKTLSDILEFANLESGTLLLSREAVEVPVLFDGVSRMFAHTAAQKGVKIVVELPESVPYVDADAEQADLLMQKLVENAVEFCPPNSRVEMRGTLVRDGSALVISVVDEGPGIDREHREVIFESFRQIESGHTRSHPGVGLGLAIARQIARAHQTDVAVESEPGSGSTFSVEFPVASASLGENS